MSLQGLELFVVGVVIIVECECLSVPCAYCSSLFCQPQRPVRVAPPVSIICCWWERRTLSREKGLEGSPVSKAFGLSNTTSTIVGDRGRRRDISSHQAFHRKCSAFCCTSASSFIILRKQGATEAEEQSLGPRGERLLITFQTNSTHELSSLSSSSSLSR